jgi:hypothetical protein
MTSAHTLQTESPLANPGFEIGWDYAHHRLVPPPKHLLAGNPVRDGWEAGQAVFGLRTLRSSPQVRKWLLLRLGAWMRGKAFELVQVTPNFLQRIDVPTCPITGEELTQGTGLPSDASVDRVNNLAGYAAGNLAVMSARANQAKSLYDWHDCAEFARQIEVGRLGHIDGLTAAHWARLAALSSLCTPLTHAEAACLPLLVLPPNRLRLLNPVQGLQALVTRELGQPAWCQRMRVLAGALPCNTLRVDFNQLLSALLPRLIEAARGHDAAEMKRALEDAWTNPLVNRRWQRFALQLDEPQVESLLRHCASRGLASGHWLQHERAQATEGWALETRGYVSPRHAACNAWPPAALHTSPGHKASGEDRHHLVPEGRQLPIGRPQLRSMVDVAAFDHQ